MVESFKNHIIESPEYLTRLSKNYDMVLKNRTLKKLGFFAFMQKWVEKPVKSIPQEFREILDMTPAELKEFSGQVYTLTVATLKEEALKAKAELEDEQVAAVAQSLGGEIALIDSERLKRLYPCSDYKTAEMRLYDIDGKRISEMHYDHWVRVVDVDTYNASLKKPIQALFNYNPIDPKPHVIEKANGDVVNVFNSYHPPQWRAMGSEGKLPPLAKKFFKHLFPDEGVRLYIYNWMHHMLVNRARTFLYLPASQGTGKTTFAYICGALVGQSNFEVGKANFVESQFNSFISKRRLVLLDEFNCHTKDDKDTLKRMVNDLVQVEAKGIDQHTIRNYCSFIICNNNPEGVQINPEDRRFSVPEVTGVKMADVFTADEMDYLNREHEKEASQFIADIGHWVLKLKPEFDRDKPWQATRFEEVVLASAREGYKHIIDTILSCKAQSYSYSKLRAEYRSLGGARNVGFPQHYDVRDYLKNFRHKGEAIATTTGSGVNMEILPIKKYQRGAE